MFAGEDGPVGEHLCQDAAHRPNIDGFGVALGVEHDLRGAVPAGGHVLRQEAGVVVLRVRYTRQTKVADLGSGH